MFSTTGTDNNNVNSQFNNFDIGDGNGQGQDDGVITEDEIRLYAKKNGLSDSQADELVQSFGSSGGDGWDKTEFQSNYKAISDKFGEELQEQFKALAHDDGQLSFNEYQAYEKLNDKTDAQIKAGWDAMTGGGANSEDTSLSFEQFTLNKAKAQDAESQAQFTEIAGQDGTVNFNDYQQYAEKIGLNADATDAGWKALTGSDSPAPDAVVDKATFDKNFKASNLQSGFVQDSNNGQAITRENVRSWVDSNPNFANYDQTTKDRIVDDTFQTLNGDISEDISAEDYASGYDKGEQKFKSYQEFAAIDKNNDGAFDQAEFKEYAMANGMTEEAAQNLWTSTAQGKAQITLDDYMNTAQDSSNQIRDSIQLGVGAAAPSNPDQGAESVPATPEQLEKEFTALTGSENQKELDKVEFIQYATQKGITDPEAAWDDIAGTSAKISKEDFMDAESGIREKFEKLFADEATKDGETIAAGSSAILGKPDVKPESEADTEIPEEQLQSEFDALTGGTNQKELNKDEFIKYATQKGFEDPEAAWTAVAGDAQAISREDFMDPEKDFRAKIEERFAGEAKEEGDTIPEGTSAILGKKDSTPETGAATGAADADEPAEPEEEQTNPDQGVMDIVTAHWNKWSKGDGKVSRDELSDIANKRGEYKGISDEESDAARFLISDGRFDQINQYAQGSSSDDDEIGRADLDAYKFDHGMGTPEELDTQDMINLGDKYIDQWKDKNGEIKFSDLEAIAKDVNRPSEERKVAQYMIDHKDDVFEALDTLDHGGDDDLFNVDQWNKFKEDQNVDRFTASDQDSANVILSRWSDWAKGDGIVSKDELEKIANPENGFSAQEQDAASYLLDHFEDVRNTDKGATKKDNQLATVNIDKFLTENNLNGKTESDDFTDKEAGKAAQGYWDNWKNLHGNDETVSIDDLKEIAKDTKRTATERATAQWLVDHTPEVFEDDKVDTDAFNGWVDGL